MKQTTTSENGLTFLLQVQEGLNKIKNEDDLQRYYRSWFQKIVPYHSIALLRFDQDEKQHRIVDSHPNEFQIIVQNQLEEGIINWAGRHGEMFISDHVILPNDLPSQSALFIPLSRNGFYGGLVEIVPKDAAINPDKNVKALIIMLSAAITSRMELLYLRKRQHEMASVFNKIKNQIQHLDKLTSLGELTGSIAHEVNNPMTTILGRLQLILQLPDIPEALRPKLEIIEREAKRIANLIHELLNFSRKGNECGLNHIVQMNDVIQKSLQLTSHYFKINQVEICTELQNDLPEIQGNPIQLQQVLINLILNAKHAMGEKGKMIIQTATEENVVVVRVRDNGCGIQPENLPHIFEPFFSTKLDAGGTGLGLSICQQIIQKHHSRIMVESEVSVGTVFSILLPIKQ